MKRVAHIELLGRTLTLLFFMILRAADAPVRIGLVRHRSLLENRRILPHYIRRLGLLLQLHLLWRFQLVGLLRE